MSTYSSGAAALLSLTLLACGTTAPDQMSSPEQTSTAAALHDIWALHTLDGQAYAVTEGLERPRLELNLTDMRASGTDGCNAFTGAIREAGAKKLAFGPLAGTRKLCRDGMAAADAFNRALTQTAAYRREGLTLTLLDGEGAALMTLRKVD